MMNKQQAYKTFWGTFGVFAFEENSVPDDEVINELIRSGVAAAKYPYITYQVLTDELNAPVFPTASIWDKSSSWERADLLSNTIAARIKAINTIRLDDGRMFITKGTPFAQHSNDEGDATIKRIVLNIGVEFLTDN